MQHLDRLKNVREFELEVIELSREDVEEVPIIEVEGEEVCVGFIDMPRIRKAIDRWVKGKGAA
jgi:hypothetical protein